MHTSSSLCHALVLISLLGGATAVGAASVEGKPPSSDNAAGTFSELYASDPGQPGFQIWRAAIGPRLDRKIPDPIVRREFLTVVWFESARARIDPALTLAIIETLSDFKKYKIGTSDARGYMQIGAEWMTKLGDGDSQKYFHMLTNIRTGCVLLRHFLDASNADTSIALVRYLSQSQDREVQIDDANGKLFLKQVDSAKSRWASRS
jgi:soluble lytic murein transglycosylase-like protein